jgi:hypothetical protein
MAKKKSKDNKPTQTTPERAEREALGLPGVGGTEIPVPTREEVLRDLERVAKPRKQNGGPSLKR